MLCPILLNATFSRLLVALPSSAFNTATALIVTLKLIPFPLVLQNFSDPTVILPDLGMPSDHGNHYMTIGPDGMIYFNLGAPFNIGSPLPAVGTRDLTFGTIARMTPDGQNISTFATGWSLKHHCGFAYCITSAQQ